MNKKTLARIKEFGDFQTPRALTDKILGYLKDEGFKPRTIIEPTCGYGSFIVSSIKYFPNTHILGMDINPKYIETILSELSLSNALENIDLRVSDFFKTDWKKLIEGVQEPILIIGNPPWITAAEMSLLGGDNIPQKSNIHDFNGIDAITGKSNFDISEWMSIQLLKSLNGRNGTFAMLCKVSVARKIVNYVNKEKLSVESSSIHLIDSRKHFNISVDACLFICTFGPNKGNYTCRVFKNFHNETFIQEIGYINEELTANIAYYQKWNHLRGKCEYTWRSGIKHDCTKVMVLKKEGKIFKNGFGHPVKIEGKYLFPLLKSSDLANNRTNDTNKFLIVTQKFVGEDTSKIKINAPLTWKYLNEHREFFGKRKSRIYKDKPNYSIFGVGEYTFSPWKIAISGFYKTLNFQLIKPIYSKPVVFDDTCYFIPAHSLEEATILYYLYNSEIASEFFRAYIFWDSKRPITKVILQKLSLRKLIKEIGAKNLMDNVCNQNTDLNPNKVRFEMKNLLKGV